MGTRIYLPSAFGDCCARSSTNIASYLCPSIGSRHLIAVLKITTPNYQYRSDQPTRLPTMNRRRQSPHILFFGPCAILKHVRIQLLRYLHRRFPAARTTQSRHHERSARLSQRPASPCGRLLSSKQKYCIQKILPTLQRYAPWQPTIDIDVSLPVTYLSCLNDQTFAGGGS